MRKPTPADRFWAKVDKTETCWLWTGATSSNGYGKVHIRPVRQSPLDTHRAVFYILYGSLPPNSLEVDHICMCGCV